MHIHIGQGRPGAENRGMELRDMIAELAAAGMTYAEIGSEVGVSQPTITRWAKGSKPDFEKIESMRALYRRRLGLTNETGTSTLGKVISLRGILRVTGAAEWYQPTEIKEVRARIYLPEGAFAFEAAETLAVFRARAGDLVLLGANVDPSGLLNREALVNYEDSSGSHSAFVVILEKRDNGTFMLLSGSEMVSRDARITAAHPYIGTLSKDGWLHVV